ncbi:MAG: F0F1 ATP synthase subunit A [Gemmatimonadaceae bacterium]
MIADATDYITPHISDSHSLDYPCFKSGWVCELELPRWKPVHIGNFVIDISPTKHVVFLWLAAALCIVLMLMAARAHRRTQAEGKAPKGVANGIEATILYFRQEIILPTVGPHGDAYVPFILSLFFFILFANLLGLVPYGSTATGNISVTATLAIVSFIMIEVAGMRTLGRNYIKTIVYWPHDQPFIMKALLTPILTPLEIASKLTKPFALAIRLFANMTAGHIVVLALLGLIFTFGSWLVAPAPLLGALGIMLIELFIAFLQAFVFALLTSVFIGLIREGAH